jgi:hypothetical protein
MRPEIQELVELLNATKLLLAKYGETQWSEWLAKDSLLIKNLDLHGVEHLLSAYGGMGSINDLLIHPTNGHKIEERVAKTRVFGTEQTLNSRVYPTYCLSCS